MVLLVSHFPAAIEQRATRGCASSATFLPLLADWARSEATRSLGAVRFVCQWASVRLLRNARALARTREAAAERLAGR